LILESAAERIASRSKTTKYLNMQYVRNMRDSSLNSSCLVFAAHY